MSRERVSGVNQPSRREVLNASGAVFASSIAACAVPGLAATQGGGGSSDSPNVILCMADDQGWGDTGYNGHPHLKTPNLDAMSGAGLRFDRFYAGSPVCSPTRASVLTGRHPFRYGIRDAGLGHLPDKEITLAELLKEHGYRTGHFGKWHLGSLTRDQEDGRRVGGGEEQSERYAPPWDHGFEVSFSTEIQVPTWDPMEDQVYPVKYWTGPEEIAEDNLKGDDSRVIMDRAIPFISKAVEDDKPFLAVIWFHTPHAPVRAGPKYRAKYPDLSGRQKNYFGSITALDYQVGRLRKKLRELRIADNTMLWYCSDNGPANRDADSVGDRNDDNVGDLKGRKRSLYEGGLRVPGILEWPNRINRGRITTVPCFTSDYFPTIAEAVGLSDSVDSRPMDGISLVPLIDGEMEQRGSRIAFQARPNNAPDHALIGDQYKFHSYLNEKLLDKDNDMLFDLTVDPGEETNLVEKLPKVAALMKAELIKWDESCKRSRAGFDYLKSRLSQVQAQQVSLRNQSKILQGKKDRLRQILRTLGDAESQDKELQTTEDGTLKSISTTLTK